ncbi:hypothetical protein F7725_023165 [Dissostichus mawsoni]|uniref:Transcription intermediary factor 1-alpha-like n=1 Tax=Dissostichus mawsoni TaxID=36200 RepID=A0A7J5Z0A7_DISMA|nr:hypothetical protein F7725_023165 [Dissostichus mawsoni]
MDVRTGKPEAMDAAAFTAENEAESKQVQEEKSAASGQNYLDSCSVCTLNFHSREPKLLPCLHSFCKKCLPSPSRNLAMAETPNSQVDNATKPLNVIRCPVCRQECMEVDVMDNVFVRDSVETPSSTVERTVQLCMTCDDNTEAAGFCADCVEYLCATCVEAHQRVKFTKDHTIRQKAEVSQEVHGVSTQRPVFCEIHKQEPLKLFCETCDLLTCRDCQLVKHKDHKYIVTSSLKMLIKTTNSTWRATHQLQEKQKMIEEVSNSINNGLRQVNQNRATVHNEIEKSICSLILEINKKGKMLVNQLEAVTKDHESVLRKQQEDIGYLSRHLDHVINFTKWATARNGGTALLYCKRLILFQIGNLLRAKCSTSFIPQSTVRFQSRSSYWASNVDLGSLLVESAPGHQLGGFQGIPHQLPHPAPGPSGSPHSFALGAPHTTLAQLQMQVEKLNPQANWQPQPPPPPWTWYQSVRLQRTIPGPLQGGPAPSHSMMPQPGRRFMVPPPNHVSPTSSFESPGFTPQPLRGMGSSYQPKPMEVFSSPPLYTHITPLPINKFTRVRCCFPGGETRHCYLETSRNTSGQWSSGSAVKKRRRLSPGPIIVIKDEPDDESGYLQTHQRASLPDSTGDQPPISTPLQSTGDKPHSPSQPPCSPRDQSKTNAQNHILGGELQVDQAPLEDSKEVLCAACGTGGELLSCDQCPRSGKWFCSFCRDLLVPEMDYDCEPEAKTVKKEPDSEGGFHPVDKRKCERLLLHLLCSKLSSDLQGPVSPPVCANNRVTIKGPIHLSALRKRLEAKQSLCYKSPAEFVSDIRLVLNQVDAEGRKLGGKLKEQFEEYLKSIFPDQTFPEIKQEMMPSAPPDSLFSSFDHKSQHAKRLRTCSDSQDTPTCPSGEEGEV